MDTFIKVGATAVIAAMIVLGFNWLVGGNQSVGGTRFPSGISVDGTSPSAGEIRSTTLTSTSGNFSTSLGVSSTTPTGDFAVGTGGATSTITGGNFCQFFQDEAGRNVWITLATSGNTVFATSTTACNQ